MGLFTTPIKSLDDLFVHTLQDMYYAENQIVKNLPEMIQKASNSELRDAFQHHLTETEGHVRRLEQVFQMHGQAVKGVDCPAMDLRQARRVRAAFLVGTTTVTLAPVIAPLPESLQQRCIAAPGLLAQVIISKYCDHLPLYRQEQIYWGRHRVWLPRQSMARWVHLASEWLKPLYRQIKEQMMKVPYLQVDETPIRYLDPGNGKTRLGYLWVAYRPGEDVLFEWYSTREAQCLEKLIPRDFKGTIQCDGYSAYNHFAKQRANAGRPVLLAGC